MVEEAKALAAFIREGGVYAALALSLSLNWLFYRRTQHAARDLLESERGRRETVEKDKDFHRQEMINAQKDHAKQLAELNADHLKKMAQAQREHRTTSEEIIPLVTEMVGIIKFLEGKREASNAAATGGGPRGAKRRRSQESPKDDAGGISVPQREAEEVGRG